MIRIFGSPGGETEGRWFVGDPVRARMWEYGRWEETADSRGRGGEAERERERERGGDNVIKGRERERRGKESERGWITPVYLSTR